MARRKKDDAPTKPNTGWMLTFGDLLTLLITFFVLLISMSSMQQKKIAQAFGFFSGALANLERAKGTRSDNPRVVASKPVPLTQGGQSTRPRPRVIPDELSSFIRRISRISSMLTKKLRDMSKDAAKGLRPLDENLMDLLSGSKAVKIKRDDQHVEVNLHLGMLFEGGKVKIRKGAIALIKETQKVEAQGMLLKGVLVPVSEHGDTAKTFSAWELAAWRSSQLIRRLKPANKMPAAVGVTGGKRYVKLLFSSDIKWTGPERRSGASVDSGASTEASVAAEADASQATAPRDAGVSPDKGAGADASAANERNP